MNSEAFHVFVIILLFQLQYKLETMSTNYIVSAQKPTVIAHAVVGNLTGPGDLNLALSKINRVELYLITPDGLKLLREIPIYGRIAVIKLFRAKDEVSCFFCQFSKSLRKKENTAWGVLFR